MRAGERTESNGPLLIRRLNVSCYLAGPISSHAPKQQNTRVGKSGKKPNGIPHGQKILHLELPSGTGTPTGSRSRSPCPLIAAQRAAWSRRSLRRVAALCWDPPQRRVWQGRVREATQCPRS